MRRITSTLLAGVAAVAMAVQPVAAQTSTTDAAISALNDKLLVVAIPITVLVEAVLIYTVFKYKDSDEAKPTRENRRLEITWTIATAAVLLFVGISASITMADDSVITPDDPEISEDAEKVDVTAYRYAWEFNYTEYNVSYESSTGPMFLAQGEQTYFELASRDWIHAFHVPSLGLKHDANPGETAYLQTTARETGTYQGYCAEYCGVGHSAMMFEVNVVEDRDALLEELSSICEEKDKKSWNEDTETCEWTGGDDGSGDDSGNESVDANLAAPTDTLTAPAASSTTVGLEA